MPCSIAEKSRAKAAAKLLQECGIHQTKHCCQGEMTSHTSSVKMAADITRMIFMKGTERLGCTTFIVAAAKEEPNLATLHVHLCRLGDKPYLARLHVHCCRLGNKAICQKFIDKNHKKQATAIAC